MVQLVLTFEKPPFVGFITEAEKRPQLEAIAAALEAAKGEPTSPETFRTP